MTILVVAETEWICQSVYHLDRKTVDEVVRSILSLRNLKILQRIDLRYALDIYDRFRMKFLEALIASNASLIGEHPQIIFYDRDFDKIGISRVEPKKVLEPKRAKTIKKKKNVEKEKLTRFFFLAIVALYAATKRSRNP